MDTFSYSIVDGLKRYTIPEETIKRVFKSVEETLPNTYPKPNKVAAAVLTKKGAIYAGVSYHTDIMSLTMHAEATALAHAAIHGEGEIIAITGPNCHACKQLLWENAIRFGNDIIILIKEVGSIKKIPLSSLMLYAWPENHWKNTKSQGSK